jgi:FkbM family methyltransferase
MYYSQSDQDKWVTEFYQNKKNGFFVEVGAYDGIQTSNTFFFEESLGWDGVCIEANPNVFNSLVKNRKSINLNYAVTDYEGECFFSNDRISNTGSKVKCLPLEKILKENDCPRKIDYLSMDIEGYEYIVLKDFNFDEFEIGVMTIEHNLYCDGNERKDLIYNLLTSKGFTRVVDNAVCLDKNPLYYNKPYEDWYVNNKLL